MWCESKIGNARWQRRLCVPHSGVMIIATLMYELTSYTYTVQQGVNFHYIPRPFPRDLLKQFTTMELMRWASLVEDYGKELREGSPDSPATDVFTYSEEGEKRWKDLKNRVVEHVSPTVKCRNWCIHIQMGLMRICWHPAARGNLIKCIY